MTDKNLVFGYNFGCLALLDERFEEAFEAMVGQAVALGASKGRAVAIASHKARSIRYWTT